MKLEIESVDKISKQEIRALTYLFFFLPVITFVSFFVYRFLIHQVGLGFYGKIIWLPFVLWFFMLLFYSFYYMSHRIVFKRGSEV